MILFSHLAAGAARLKNIWARLSLPAFDGVNNPWKHKIYISLPREIAHPGLIRIGKNVVLGPNSVLKPIVRYAGVDFTPRIRIGERVVSTESLQVYATELVEIGDDVLFAKNVFISDALHGISRLDIAYIHQPLERIAPVRIGARCWIGQNVVILPGVTIGEGAVIGANSVVTKSVPAACVAAGAPAKVLRHIGDPR